MDAALQADLGGAARVGLDGASRDLVHAQEVGGAAQVLRELALREGAEAALEVADVRVVDVPADDVGDPVAGALEAAPVGSRGEQLDLGPACREQRRRVVLVEQRARLGALEGALEGGGDPADGLRTPARPPGGRRLGDGARRPALAPREPEPVGGGERRAARVPGEPGLGVGEELGIDREARQEGAPRRGAGRLEPRDVRPGRLGVHVVGRHGRDAAEVVDAGCEQRGELLAREVRRRLHRDLGRQHEARDRDRPEVIVERGLRRLGHLRAGLRAEVLHDDLLQVPVLGVQVAKGDQGLDALAPRLADADQDAARVRDPQPPRTGDRVDAHGRHLVGRAEVRTAALRQTVGGRLQHDPLRRADLAQRQQLVVVEDAGVRVRQEAGLAQHLPRDVREVRRGGLEAETRELLARGPVAELGLVAEGEERLATAGLGPLACDLDGLVDREVGAFAPLRRPRERAVVAHVAAQHRERDEDLGRVRDPDPVLLVAHPAGGGEQPVEPLVERLLGQCQCVRVGKHAPNRTRVRYESRARRRGAMSRAKLCRNPSWSSPGAWKTRWWKPSS